MANIKIVKLSEIESDKLNANRHTERGNKILKSSIKQFGFAEAGTLDKHNRIIGGNHRTEVSAEVLAADEAIVIEVDGSQPVYIKRNDLDLSTEEGRRLSYYLNRSAQVSIDFDPERVLADIQAGVELGDMFREDELKEILEEIDVEDYKDFDDQLTEIGGFADVNITITIPRKHKDQVIEWLSNGENSTSPGLGKGVMKHCGLL